MELINKNKVLDNTQENFKKNKVMLTENNKKLREMMSKHSENFNNTDYTRIYKAKFFHDNYKSYWNNFTVGEMEFLFIFKKRNGEKLFEKVVKEYYQYLQKDHQNSLTYLKGLLQKSNSLVKLSEKTKAAIQELFQESHKKESDLDLLDLRKKLVAICNDLQVTSEFISYCRTFEKQDPVLSKNEK